MGLLSVILLDDLSGNQCGCLILSQVNCLSMQEKSSRDNAGGRALPSHWQGQGCASAKRHFPAFEVANTGSFNASEGVKPDTVKIIGIKEEL